MINWLTVGYFAFLVETAAAFAISVLVVRGLSVEDFGAYKLAGAIIMLGSYATSCGLDSTLQRFGAELYATRRFAQLFKLLRYVRLVRVVALLAFCSLLLLFREPLGAAFNFTDSLQQVLLIVCGVLIVQSTNQMNGFTFFAVRGSPVDSSVLRSLAALLRLGGISIAVMGSLGLGGILGGTLAAGLLALAYVLFRNWQWRRALPPAESAPIEGGGQAYRARIIRYSLVGYLAVNVNVFRDLSIDLFVIAWFLGAQDVAIYGMATTLIMFANALNPAALLRGAINPMVVAGHVTGKDESYLPRTFLLLSKAVVSLYFPLVVFLIVLGDEVISLFYSAELAPAYECLLVMCAFGFFQAMTYPFGPLIAALEKNTLLFLSSATSIFNLGMSIWLVPRIGVIGAAVATGLASVLHLALYWLVFRHGVRLRLAFPFKAVLRTAVNLVPAVAIALLARPWLDDGLTLMAVTLVGAALYGLAMYWNHDLSADEMAMLRKATARRTA
jgi:O-antigen/teichoic acid export membrane protein